MEHQPYVPAHVKVPELTLRAALLGAVLSAVLAGANAYLGLFAGMTVSASIPAAVMSMAILRLYRNNSILENNAVQTAASAGESLAAGVIFTLPALILMGYWNEFNYRETVFIALSGGVLGVLFTIPLRRALIVRQALQFPEGMATAEVLKSGEEGGRSVVFLVWAALLGGLVKFAEMGLGLWHSVLEKAVFTKGKQVLFFGMNLSPALIAVGYIVGLRIAVLVFAGGVITWWIAIPAYLAWNGPSAVMADLGLSSADGPAALAFGLWSAKLRYLGVGAMVVGGLWAVVSLRSALGMALREGLEAFRRGGQQLDRMRTDLDTPMSWVLIGIGVMIVPVFVIYQAELGLTGISLFLAVVMVVAGFLFSAVAGYMAGLVGSSNNPISGVTIATILSASLMLLVLLGSGGDALRGAAGAILLGAVVCCAAAIAGDNMQDLKSGYLLGATPRNQQIMQMLGVAAAAITLPVVLNLLHQAYTIGSNELSAPQAKLMASVATGVFERNLPWTLIGVGAGIAVLVILADEFQRRRGASFRIPVLAVGVGLYLPFELDSAIMFGGLIAWAVSRSRHLRGLAADREEGVRQAGERAGLLFASGLITGEALLGIGLAVPIALTSNPDLYPLWQGKPQTWLGALVVLGIGYMLYALANRAFARAARGQ
jgi:putative OPT family oligopeptide transporter